MTDPKSANDYDDRGARAVYAVLLEIGQLLGSYRNNFVVIGGSVPWLLLPDAEPAHVGTLDIDLSLDAEALGDGAYKGLIDTLVDAGYERGLSELRNFQLRRTVPIDAFGPVTVIIELLMPREAKFIRNKPPLLADFAVLKADGASVAMASFVQHRLEGTMPDGRPNTVELRVASIPAFPHSSSSRDMPCLVGTSAKMHTTFTLRSVNSKAAMTPWPKLAAHSWMILLRWKDSRRSRKSSPRNLPLARSLCGNSSVARTPWAT